MSRPSRWFLNRAGRFCQSGFANAISYRAGLELLKLGRVGFFLSCVSKVFSQIEPLKSFLKSRRQCSSKMRSEIFF